MLDLTALIAEANANDDVDASAGFVIDRLLAEVEASKTDPAAVQAVVDQFRASRDKLTEAIVRGTPAEVPPVEEPPVEPPVDPPVDPLGRRRR